MRPARPFGARQIPSALCAIPGKNSKTTPRALSDAITAVRLCTCQPSTVNGCGVSCSTQQAA